MNLRTLKKLSKRAAPYLERIGDTRNMFKAEKDHNYHGLLIRDMNRLERIPSRHMEVISVETHVATIAPKSRAGSAYPFVKLLLPSHPLKGPQMVGCMSGYYEPEWDEETAWSALSNWVYNHFMDYDPATEDVIATRRFRSPAEIFAAADELLSVGS